MKKITNFILKSILFVLSMLCFHFGAKAQQYRLASLTFKGANNGGPLQNQSKQVYFYNNSTVPFDTYSDVEYFAPDAVDNNIWIPTQKATYNYPQTAPFNPLAANYYLYTNGSYSNSPNLRETYTYTSVGAGTQEIRLVEQFNNGQWTPNMRETNTKNAAGLTTNHSLERYNNGAFMLFFEVANVYDNGTIPAQNTMFQYDWNTGAFIQGIRGTYAYNTAGEWIEEIEEIQYTPNGSFFNRHMSLHSYTNGKRTQTLSYQPSNGIWSQVGVTDITYNNNVKTETITGINNTTGQFENLTKVIWTTHTPTGKEQERETQHWINGSWVTLNKMIWDYNVTTSSKNIAPTLDLVVFPNPTVDKLQIKNLDAEAPVGYQIFDTHSRIILQGTLTNEQNDIDVSHLATGTYHLRVNEKAYKPIAFVKI
jgi:Secretion system C-terminal sorting domain